MAVEPKAPAEQASAAGMLESYHEEDESSLCMLWKQLRECRAAEERGGNNHGEDDATVPVAAGRFLPWFAVRLPIIILIHPFCRFGLQSCRYRT
jgi:hypothetical protein